MSAPTRERIDPRIRDRRAQVTRERARRRRRVLVVVVVLALAAVAGFGLVQSPLLSVETIEVQGATRIDADEIRAESGIDPGDPVVFADLAEASRRIETIPWIASAKVERRLPRTISIEVTERVPVAWLRDLDGAVALVDRDARVLEVVGEPPPLVQISGLAVESFEPGSTATPASLAALATDLPAELRSRVVEIVRVDEAGEPGAVLVLVDGPEVRLGSLEQLEEKASAALAVLAASEDHEASYLDVSVPVAPITG